MVVLVVLVVVFMSMMVYETFGYPLMEGQWRDVAPLAVLLSVAFALAS